MVFILVAVLRLVVDLFVQPIGTIHKHEKALEALRVDGVNLHHMGLQGRVFWEGFLAKRARWRSPVGKWSL